MTSNQNRTRQRTIVFALAIIVLFPFLPRPDGLSSSAVQVLGIFLGVLLLWVRLSIDWPSLLALGALAFVPELSFNKILQDSIGGSTFSFLLFTFLCTFALSQTPFIRRCALSFVNSKVAQKGPWHFALLFFASALILGLFMSPTVLFVIYLTILEEINAVLNLQKEDKYANMLMMGMTFSIALSSGMTPIAHVFSIMAMGFYEAATGLAINIFDYMLFGIPVGLLSFGVMMILFKFILRPDTTPFTKNHSTTLTETAPPMDKKELLALIIFGAVVVVWVAPGFIEFFNPTLAKTINRFGTALPPLIGAVIMTILTVDGKPILNFTEGMSKGVSWGALIMTASTLALGSAMTNEDIGLISWLSASIEPLLSRLSPMLLVVLFTFWAAIQTNLSSNMVTVTVVSAVALPLCLASNGAVSTPAIASIIGLMSAFAFATPPAHPNVALAGGSGWTNPTQLMIYGFTLMIASVLITAFVGYPIALSLMGL